jgi:hypothetical protein
MLDTLLRPFEAAPLPLAGLNADAVFTTVPVKTSTEHLLLLLPSLHSRGGILPACLLLRVLLLQRQQQWPLL